MRIAAAVSLSVLIVVFASACARETSAGRRETGANRNSPALSADATGQEIFRQVCAGCHGPEGNEMPDWKREVREMTDAQVRDQIRNGGGGMPAYGDQLTEEQINRVAEYAQQLARS